METVYAYNLIPLVEDQVADKEEDGSMMSMKRPC